MKDFIQFVLWNDCKSGCLFCVNRYQKQNDKLKVLSFVKEKLNSDEIHDEIDFGLMGGEFFDDQLKDSTVKNKFYELFPIIKQKIDEKKIGRLLITTALLFDKNKYLVDFLEYLKELDLIKHTVLCTSYDTIYRFKNENAKKLWNDNMLYLKQTYPDLRLHTEIIITKHFIESVLNGIFDINRFKRTYHTAVDYIDPMADKTNYPKNQVMKDLPEFFPSMNLFLSFLQYLYEYDLVDWNTFLNMNVRANHSYAINNGEIVLFDNRRDDKDWGSDLISHGFSDSEQYMRDVVDEFLETV